MSKPYLGLRGNNLTWTMILTIVFPAYFMAGYNNAVPGGLLSLDSFVETFPTIDTIHTTGAAQQHAATIQGTMIAIYLVGCVIGALSCIAIGDILGRIKMIILGSAITVVGLVTMSSSYSLGQLIAARVINGIGLGAVVATVPAWQAECSPAGHRGALVVLEGFFATVGLAASQFVDLGCFFSKTSLSWRLPLAVPLLCSITMLIMAPFLPESPRWLVKKGRAEEARNILVVLNDNDDAAHIEEDIQAMERSLQIMGSGSFGGLLRDKGNMIKLRTLLAMFSTFSQQMNGAGLVGFYTTGIFLGLGLDPIVARVLAGCVYVFQMPCCYACSKLIDRMGRRAILLLGAAGMGISFAVLSGTMSQGNDNKACTVVAAIAIFGYTFSFGISYAVNWLFPAEVAPLAYRTQIYALTTATQFGTNFMVVEVTPLALTNIGYKYFIVWTMTCLFMIFPVTYFFFPETTGHSLEDMDNIFRVAKSPLDVVRVSKRVRKDNHRAKASAGDTNINCLEATDGQQVKEEGLTAPGEKIASYEVETV